MKTIGAEEKERQKRELIIEILTIVFSVMPFAGWGAAAATGIRGFVQIARIVGEVGNVALTVAEIIEDPLSAPFALMGMLMGGSRIR